MSVIASVIRFIEFISTFRHIGLFCPLLNKESNNYTKGEEVQRGDPPGPASPNITKAYLVK